MSKINLMNAELANRIAAGEVIDRPASVVKELVENSIDAKSKRIQISISEAGKKEIRVADDGTGMDRVDAELCFLRHASSKLKSIYDLRRITTMGFRGEALPSIASISNVEMTTYDGGNAPGTKVTIVPGSEPIIEDSLQRKGTIFTVRNLFFNTPARLKYLKSDMTENAAITEIVEQISLGYPEISFSLTIDGREVLKTSGHGNLLEAISEVYGIESAKKMISIEGENGFFKIKGFICEPSVSYANRYHQLSFINKRPVTIIKANAAFNAAYKDYLPPNRYPFTILFVEVDYSLIDINVHPSKKEVRISHEEKLASLIEDTAKKALFKTRPEYATPVFKKVVEVQIPSASKNVDNKPQQMSLNDVLKENSNIEILQHVEEINSKKEEIPSLILNDIEKNEAVEEKVETYFFPEKEEINVEKSFEEIINEPKTTLPELFPIGQVLKTYIVCDGEDGMYLIDQHAAAERINYEKAVRQFNSLAVETTIPLMPLIVELPSSLMLRYDRKHQEMLKSSGFITEEFTTFSLRVEEFPTVLKDDEDGVRDIIISVLKDEKMELSELKHLAIATVACKASIKANMFLTLENMKTLIQELNKCHNPANCPHGRPTVIKLSKYEIEKLFKRTGF